MKSHWHTQVTDTFEPRYCGGSEMRLACVKHIRLNVNYHCVLIANENCYQKDQFVLNASVMV